MNKDDIELLKKELDQKIQDDDLIEGVPYKSLDEIISEVASEENMSEEEVEKALKKMLFHLKGKESKQDKGKKKKKKKISKQSKKRNRK